MYLRSYLALKFIAVRHIHDKLIKVLQQALAALAEISSVLSKQPVMYFSNEKSLNLRIISLTISFRGTK